MDRGVGASLAAALSLGAVGCDGGAIATDSDPSVGPEIHKLVSGGEAELCAIAGDDRAVYCAGEPPETVPEPNAGWRNIELGGACVCGLRDDGSGVTGEIQCWAWWDDEEDVAKCKYNPAEGGFTVLDRTAGNFVAVRPGEDAHIWGNTYYDGSDEPLSQDILQPLDVVAITGGGGCSYCVVTSGGLVYCDDRGEAAPIDQTYTDTCAAPLGAVPFAGVYGGNMLCAIDVRGQLRCIGGDGNYSATAPVPPGHEWLWVDARGSNHGTCAVTDKGELQCFGDDYCTPSERGSDAYCEGAWYQQEFDVQGPLEAVHRAGEALYLVREGGQLDVWTSPDCDDCIARPTLWEQWGVELPDAASSANGASP